MTNLVRRLMLVAGLTLIALSAAAAEPEPAGDLVRQAFNSNPAVRADALAKLEARGKPDVAAGLIQALRFVNDRDGAIGTTLRRLTGASYGSHWFTWMEWQQAHPEVMPFAGFDAFKANVMALIDPNFRDFLYAGVPHEIRLEEIAWGGVVKDGIPALIDPRHVPAADAGYLDDDELVFGVAIDGDARAYPLRIMDWHEMFNDVVGGVPVALAYCTLCGSGILFETLLDDRDTRLVFGSSGFLNRSNKLMYDHGTNSLWNQFTGRPVVGPLTGSGIELRIRPVAITTWAAWRERQPQTQVLSLETGYARDYTPGRPYAAYFNSPDLMFPAPTTDDRLKPKDYVYALRVGTGEAALEKAWPLTAFEGGAVVNDRVGDTGVVLIGDAATRTVRAYDRGAHTFTADGDGVAADGVAWQVTEDALVGPDGSTLARLPGHIAYWFAWSGYKPDAAFFDGG